MYFETNGVYIYVNLYELTIFSLHKKFFFKKYLFIYIFIRILNSIFLKPTPPSQF